MKSSVPRTVVARRTYNATNRRAQAERMRDVILVAARRLFETHGFDAATIAAIAREASCSASAIYAAFGSKTGLLTAIAEQTAFGEGYDRALQDIAATDTPGARLRAAAHVARTIYETEQHEFAVLRGAGLVAPELTAWEAKLEQGRYRRQEWVARGLAKALRPGLPMKRARERLWALTSRELYRHLVTEKGWSPAAFEAWLGDLLIRDLLAEVSP